MGECSGVARALTGGQYPGSRFKCQFVLSIVLMKKHLPELKLAYFAHRMNKMHVCKSSGSVCILTKMVPFGVIRIFNSTKPTPSK